MCYNLWKSKCVEQKDFTEYEICHIIRNRIQRATTSL